MAEIWLSTGHAPCASSERVNQIPKMQSYTKEYKILHTILQTSPLGFFTCHSASSVFSNLASYFSSLKASQIEKDLLLGSG